MATSAIFQGTFAKLLKQNINLFDKAYILSGTADPTVTATSAPKGSLYLRQHATDSGQLYKKNDDGLSTNWEILVSGSNSSAPYADLYDLASTTLPTTNPTIIDGVTVTTGMTAFFNNLSVNNNSIYKAGVGVAAWSAPFTGTGQITDVDFTSNLSTIIAASGNGTSVYKSVDQGATWTALSHTMGSNVFAIHVLNDNVFWCDLGGVSVGKTLDGGANWTTYSTGIVSRTISAADASTVVIAGVGGDVYRTINGGTSWTPMTSGVTTELLDIYRFDSQKLWIVGHTGTIIYSSNGGVTWSTQTTGTTQNLTSISGIDDQTIYAVSDSGQLLKTINGGTTWTITSYPSVGTVKSFVSATSATDVWIATLGGAVDLVLYSANSGSSWSTSFSGVQLDPGCLKMKSNSFGVFGTLGSTIRTFSQPLSWTQQYGAFRNGSNTINIGERIQIGLGSVYGGYNIYRDSSTVYLTNGASLTNANIAQADLYDLSSTTLPTALPPIVDGVTMTSGQTAFFSNLSANNGTVHKAAIVTPTWAFQTTDTPPLEGVIYAASTSIAYAVGNSGAIKKTTDGGATWVAQTSGTAQSFRGVSGFGTNIVVASGTAGTIVYTSNGGTTWNIATTGVGNFLPRVRMVSATVGYAVGFGGVILKTTDGGANWTSQTSGTSEALRDISFIDISTGWVVGDNSTVLKTTNGGTTWTPQTTGVVGVNFCVSALDANNVFVSNNNSPASLLKTTNGGTSWSSVVLGSANSATSLIAFSASEIWYSDGFPKIWKTVNGGTSWTQEYSAATGITNSYLSFVPGSTTAAWLIYANNAVTNTNFAKYSGSVSWTQQEGLFKGNSASLGTGESIRIGAGTLFAGQTVYKDGSGNFLVNDSVKRFNGNKGTDFIELQAIRSVTLADNTASAAAITVPLTGYQNMVIDYSLSRGAGNVQTGVLYVTSDGTSVAVATTSTELGVLGTTFAGDINSGNIRVLYTTTSTGTAVAMKYSIRRWGT
jgi:photosystem II stability/assembly factor-like uncharacterized protein